MLANCPDEKVCPEKVAEDETVLVLALFYGIDSFFLSFRVGCYGKLKVLSHSAFTDQSHQHP